MEKTEILELVDFFNQIEIEEEDITTDEQKADNQLVLEVTYKYQDQVFVTKPLFYKKVSAQNNVKNEDYISFFGITSLSMLTLMLKTLNKKVMRF